MKKTSFLRIIYIVANIAFALLIFEIYDSNTIWLLIIAIPAVMAFYIVLLRLGDQMLHDWADDNGYKILKRQRAFLTWKLFFWTTSRAQILYRVTVIDVDGNERHGLVRCGGWWLGLLINKADVKWDD